MVPQSDKADSGLAVKGLYRARLSLKCMWRFVSCAQAFSKNRDIEYQYCTSNDCCNTILLIRFMEEVMLTMLWVHNVSLERLSNAPTIR